MSSPNQAFRHWSPEINIKYFLFAALHFQQMNPPQNAIRRDKIFIKMSKWIPEKTHRQCRSHHTKQVGKFQNGFSDLMKEAVHSHFTIRFIPISHMRREAQMFLNEIKKMGQIDGKEMSQYMARADQFIYRYQKKKNVSIQTNQQKQFEERSPKNAKKGVKKGIKLPPCQEDPFFQMNNDTNLLQQLISWIDMVMI